MGNMIDQSILVFPFCFRNQRYHLKRLGIPPSFSPPASFLLFYSPSFHFISLSPLLPQAHPHVFTYFYHFYYFSSTSKFLTCSSFCMFKDTLFNINAKIYNMGRFNQPTIQFLSYLPPVSRLFFFCFLLYLILPKIVKKMGKYASQVVFIFIVG